LLCSLYTNIIKLTLKLKYSKKVFDKEQYIVSIYTLKRIKKWEEYLMNSLNKNVVNLLNNQLWYIAAYSDEPNAVPVLFKEVTSEGKLIIGDVFLRTTLEILIKMGKYPFQYAMQ
jgi:hypothetical protein